MIIKNKTIVWAICLFTLLYTGCTYGNRDTDFKGTILTQRQLFSFGWWGYSTGNVTIFDDTVTISSAPLQADSNITRPIFMLKPDNTVAITNKQHNSVNPNGHWQFNTADSLISIGFGNSGLAPIQGKMVSVTNTDLVITITSYITPNNPVAGKKPLKKVTTIWFGHGV